MRQFRAYAYKAVSEVKSAPSRRRYCAASYQNSSGWIANLPIQLRIGGARAAWRLFCCRFYRQLTTRAPHTIAGVGLGRFDQARNTSICKLGTAEKCFTLAVSK
jgi:hypothetical protein